MSGKYDVTMTAWFANKKEYDAALEKLCSFNPTVLEEELKITVHQFVDRTTLRYLVNIYEAEQAHLISVKRLPEPWQ